ncbi:MAG TPA: hypothetical protein VNH11_29395 [Pirellulales bacterium]|nr:hypothetical protein [Pirellulales bacterium]
MRFLDRFNVILLDLHELGYVPNAYAKCLRRLATTHRLGLVTNIWSKKDRWVDELNAVRSRQG